jgi:glycerol kinase
MMKPLILALDQGTTSSRAILFDEALATRGLSQHEFTQHFPGDGAVEHDPEDLWRTTLQAARDALAHAGAGARAIAAIGIANQRETTLVWDRRSGEPIHRAIVWQDRRTAEECRRLRAAGYEPDVAARTGLLLDPYFSATKIAWILDRVAGARAAAEAGHLAFGTVDSWLVWRLTGGAAHVTDATNASRTLLFDIHQGVWDEDLLRVFRVPAAMLPEVRECADDFGVASPHHLGAAVPILGIAGDQQAAAIGQACFAPGMMGDMAPAAASSTPAASRGVRQPPATTIAYQPTTSAARSGAPSSAAQLRWLRDGSGVIGNASRARAGHRSRRARTHPCRLRRPWRPALARGGARRAVRPHSRHRPGRTRARCAAGGRLPDAGPARRRAPGLPRGGSGGAARGRRHGGERLDDAVPRRHAGRPRGPARGAGDDGLGRGVVAAPPPPARAEGFRGCGNASAASCRR